jgi:hypothetical protein
MKPAKMCVPQDLRELLEFAVSVLSSAQMFADKTGYFPHQNLDYVFRQLFAGLSLNKPALGEQRYEKLIDMSDRMRALFEAEPEDKTGETLLGCKIIHQMEDMLRDAARKS